MSVQVCVALLALLSLTAASDPGCEEFSKKLEDRTTLHGRWIMYAQTSDCEDTMAEFRNNTSSWLELIPQPNSTDMTLRYGDRINGKCDIGSTNATDDGNATKITFYYDNAYHDHYGGAFETCPDCMIWVDSTVNDGRTCKCLFFYSKTGNLTDSQKEVFKKQSECLKISQDQEFAFGGTEDLCPDEKEEATEVKKEEQ